MYSSFREVIMWKRQLFHAIGIMIVGMSAGTLLQAEQVGLRQQSGGACSFICTEDCPADEDKACGALGGGCEPFISCSPGYHDCGLTQMETQCITVVP